MLREITKMTYKSKNSCKLHFDPKSSHFWNSTILFVLFCFSIINDFLCTNMFYFSHSGPDTSNYLHDDTGICHVTAILREKGESSDVTTVCSGGVRQKQVYTSLTDALEVRILGSKSSREPTYFLLKYEGTLTLNIYLRNLQKDIIFNEGTGF